MWGSVNSTQSKQTRMKAKLSFQTSTVRQSIQGVAFVAETLKASRVVDAGVVTGPFKGTLIYIWINRKSIKELDLIKFNYWIFSLGCNILLLMKYHLPSHVKSE